MQKRRMLKHYGKPCAYCRLEMGPDRLPSRDHAERPKSRRGKLTAGNKVICCEPCNVEKRDRPIWIWAVELEQAGDPRAGNVQAEWLRLKAIRDRRVENMLREALMEAAGD